MIRLWWTLGSQEAAPPPVQGAMWVWPMTMEQHRVYTNRVRDDYWVEDGHLRTTNPDTDSREG